MGTWYKTTDGEFFNLDRFVFIDQMGNKVMGFFDTYDKDGIRESILIDVLENEQEARVVMSEIGKLLGVE